MGIFLIVIGVCCLFFSVNSGIYIVLGIIFIGWGLKIIAQRAPNSQTDNIDPEAANNQEELMQTAFSLAEKYGGMWRISFTSERITIYRGDNSRQYVQLGELGYSNLNLQRGFPRRLKQAAESKGYLFWNEMIGVAAEGSTYTSHDGGHSYSREDAAGKIVGSANVCTADYYRKFKPYNVPGHPLKKL